MASLRDLQQSFANALRQPGSPCAVRPAGNLDVYRHNGDHQFHNALALSYPVLRQRVGDDYFRQLVHHYRRQHPSRSGDLHWAGEFFAGFLALHLADGDYGWLADLARLEWARELASVADTRPAIRADALAEYAAADLEHVVFTCQPALQLLSSRYPIFTLWAANQRDDAPPVDQSIGSEQGMVLPGDEGAEIRPLSPRLFSYLVALSEGAPLGVAVSRAGMDEGQLLDALQFVFGAGLVTGLALGAQTSG